MIQDSLNQPEVNVAAPTQEIPQATNSDAATEALASHTLSIFFDNEDDDTTEVLYAKITMKTRPIKEDYDGLNSGPSPS